MRFCQENLRRVSFQTGQAYLQLQVRNTVIAVAKIESVYKRGISLRVHGRSDLT